MGKLFMLGIAIAAGYAFGFRDARQNSENIVARAVVQVRIAFGGRPANDVDAIMTRVEGKN